MSGEAYASQPAVFWPRLCPFVFYNYGSFMSFRPRELGADFCQLVIAQVSSLRVRTVGLSVCDSPTFTAPRTYVRTRAHAYRIYARALIARIASENVNSPADRTIVSPGATPGNSFLPLSLHPRGLKSSRANI